jgi:hypothetical protein
MTDYEIKLHDARRAWWLRLYEEAARLGVEQITDAELIAANLASYNGVRPGTVAKFIKSQRDQQKRIEP